MTKSFTSAPMRAITTPVQPVPADWYPRPKTAPYGDHREPMPMQLRQRNRRSGGSTGCMPCPVSPKPSPLSGGAAVRKEAIAA